MERINGKIVHSLDEQNEFSVDPEVDLATAVETAIAFKDAAQKIWRRAEANKAAEGDSLALLEAHKNQSRAVRLNMYAAGVLDLCPDIVQKRQG